MFALARPRSGRVITGVTKSLAERYRVSVVLLRTGLVAFTLVSPVVLLLYLLLSIAIPDEERVASQLSEWPHAAGLSGRKRFEHFTSRLIRRFSPVKASRTTWISLALLFFAAILELPRSEGTAFYWTHPILTSIGEVVSNVAPIVFYLSLALLFVIVWIPRESLVVFPLSERDRFLPDCGPAKMLGGIASGLSRTIGIDAAYLRVLLILLNIFTLGLVGIGYLILWYLERSKNASLSDESDSKPAQEPTTGSSKVFFFRVSVAVLVGLLGIIYIATEDRWFFFNRSLFQGGIMVLVGLAFVWREIRRSPSQSIFGLLVGAVIFLSGIYSFASAVGNLQIGSVDRFEILAIIGAIAFAYIALVTLRAEARTLGLLSALVLAVCAAMIGLHVTPPEYIAAIVRFYDFFYPIIYAALGLWISFDR